jgi:transposase
MFERVPRDTKLNAVITNQKGVRQADIGAALGISESTIKRAKARERKYGDIEAGYQKCGRKPLFGPCMRDVFPSSICSS